MNIIKNNRDAIDDRKLRQATIVLTAQYTVDNHIVLLISHVGND
jgi:hypothetical protein